MTRERIADGLELLVQQLANGDTALPDGWQLHEWAYVKGIASGAIMQFRNQLVVAGR